MTFDPTVDYPLGSRRPDLVETPSGLALDEVTLEAARAGTLVAADVRATSATLRRQAEVARATGRRQLADNLERAAELAGVPDDQLLEIYTALRPGRSTPAELEEWARPARRLGCAAHGRLRPRGGGRVRGTRARRCLSGSGSRFASRAAKELRREMLDHAAAGARPRRGERAERPRAGARGRERRRHADGRAGRRRLRRHRPLPRRPRARPRDRRRGDGAAPTSRSRACSSTSTSRGPRSSGSPAA